MKVCVLLFGPLASTAGARRVEVDLPPNSTLHTLRQRLHITHPALARHLPTSRFALNHEFAPDESTISPSDEIALIAAVSGG